MAGCASNPMPVDPVKTIALQYNPTGAKVANEVVGKAVFAAQGWIEGQLPVRVDVLDPALEVDTSKACEIRFVSHVTLLSLALNAHYSSTAIASYTGPQMYPCQILLSDVLTDVDRIRLALQHEVGHIVLDMPHHNPDPASIMSNGVSLPGRYRFTDSDLERLHQPSI